jgi:hypothetical protein
VPFSCRGFHELLLAVRQATREKAFEVKYVSIVARFFNDFAEITSRDGYDTEVMVSSLLTPVPPPNGLVLLLIFRKLRRLIVYVVRQVIHACT